MNELNTEPQEIPWSLYWSQDQLHSFVAGDYTVDRKLLDDVWRGVAGGLGKSATVLDLATGNGAVPSVLLTTNKDLNIIAIDQADIEPTRFVRNQPELGLVDFRSNCNIESTDFLNHQFDAITSQFGIEYSDITAVSMKARSWLSQSGQMVFVVHHADSEIVQSSKLKIEELQQLLKEGGVLDALFDLVRQRSDFAMLERCGQTYLQQGNAKTKQISGQVFSGIEKIAALLHQSHEPRQQEQAKRLAATLKMRVDSELQRLIQLNSAAMSERQIKTYQKRMLATGFSSCEYEALISKGNDEHYLLAWKISATR